MEIWPTNKQHTRIRREIHYFLPPTLGSYRRRKDTWMDAALLATVYDEVERGEETLFVALDLGDAYLQQSGSVLLS